ncbi:MAG TPA: (2Fe-2S)-binding protein [Candidatus Limnocylindrales bacterium]|nr:(2Fe-2S)-binding protein [Candidatus Limnocylindrales bacterium]
MSESPQDRAKCEISLTVNGQLATVRVHAMERLLDVLRHEFALTGTKEGCGEGECGSCSILMDGILVNSCLIPVLQASGANVVTIEGLASDGQLQALQQAFLDCGGAQCGICTPGMILAAFHLLSKKPQPTVEEIREGLSGNLCRCTGYMQIFEAVREASRRGAKT